MVKVRQGFGWIGSLLFAFCAVPQVYVTWTTKMVDGLSFAFILMWFLGEVFSTIYLLWDDYINKTRHYPIYFNYLINGLCVTYLLYAIFAYQ